jgi:DNA adenine methylase
VITRPVLRYPGGKYKLAKWVISHFPQHSFYVEPYGGAGSVLMAKPKVQGEIYNDLDGDVVNVFRVLRDPLQAKELERLIRLTPFSYEEYKRAYEFHEDPIERARRIVFRSFASIGSDGVSRRNSGFRGLKNNETSVTAAQEWSRYPEAIQAFVDRLQSVLIEQRPALHLLKLYDRIETLFYVDPPYLMSTRSKSSVLYANELKEQDHIDLARSLHSLKGMVVLSGYPSILYDQLYSDWRKISKSATAQNGKGRVECLWLSPNIQTTLF